MSKLYSWQDCSEFDIETIKKLYGDYISRSQVKVFSPFGFSEAVCQIAEGIVVKTNDGRDILDFTGGIGVLNHGHNHPRIIRARKEFQDKRYVEVHKNFLSGYLAGLSHNIAQLLPSDLNISYFVNSGAESVEGACKLAYKYHAGKRNSILHSDISFHGKLLGAGGLSGSPELHFRFPTIPGIHEFKYNDIASVEKIIRLLRNENGESDIYAIILEPFSASSLLSCSKSFLTALREVCTKEDIVLIFDEVYTGWAKAGELFYFMKENVIPDIVTYAKSFGGGKSSISGYTSREHFFRRAYDNLQDVTLHSTTYNGFGEETITAIEAVNIIIEENFVEKSKHIYDYLHPKLCRLKAKYPKFIKEVRGSGALNGLIFDDNLVPYLTKLLPLIPNEMFKDDRLMSKLITSAVINEMYNEYDILLFFGSNKDIPLIISPSLVVKNEQLDHFVSSLDKTLAKGRANLLRKFISSFLNSKRKY